MRSRTASTPVFRSILLMLVGLAGCVAAQRSDRPTEVDTVIVGRPVKIDVHGEILRKRPDGSLAKIASGETVNPGEVLLVRQGASFRIENDTIGAETHGDRWVQFR